MILQSLTLSHFRSHRLTRLDFDGRPVAVFGANGAGKTNLIEAVSLLSPGRGLRGAGAEELARRPEGLGWKVTAALAGHEVETWAEPGEGRQVRIDGKAAAQVALGGIAPVLWLIPAMDRLWIEGAEGRRRFLDRATLSFVPDHAQAVLDHDRAMRERNRLLKDMVRDPAWYRALEDQMARAGARISANRRLALAALAAAQGLGDAAFPAADLALIWPEADWPEGEDALRTAMAEGRGRDLAAGRTLYGPHRADLAAVWRAKAMPADQCSTGEQKALLISLILANARALGAGGRAPVILLDEVAAHLDRGRRAALFDAVCALQGQVMMTGTGADLFLDLGGRAQHLDVVEVQGESRVMAAEGART
jgi:DNA replication and repair protein RecF